MKTKIFENEARVLLGITDDSKALAEVKVPNAFPKNLEHLNLKWVKTGHDPYAGP